MSTPPALSRFEIRHLLGEGGSGAVYLAWDRTLSREVALKLVPLKADPDSMLEEERNGATLQQKLGRISPQVPQVYDFGEEGEFFWISMEYVAGTDLSTALRYGHFPEGRAVHIAIQLCDFLIKTHEFTDVIGGHKILGVVHGDIKPQNIRLQDGDRVRVIDFGIAKQLSLSRSFTQSFYGTFPYTPPEQLRDGKAKKASDLWAVGVVLYQMVSGRLPVRAGSVEQVKRQVLDNDLLPLPDDCSDGLRWIVNTSLAREPEWRHTSAFAMKEHLLRFREGTFTGPTEQPPSHDTTRQRGDRWPAPPAPPPPPPPPPPQQDFGGSEPGRSEPQKVPQGGTPMPQRRWASWIWTCIALLVVLLIGSQGYVWWKAESIRRHLLADPSGVDEDWQRYQGLHRIDPFGIARRKVRTEMKLALTHAANRILAQYAEDDPRVSREEWEQALHYLAAALELDGSDQENRARSAYCRGHLALADAKSLKKEGDSQGAQEKREEAIAEFRQASALDGTWPDPHISLARIYGYEQFDLAKLASEIEEAKRRGYHDVRRLIAYQADAEHRQGWDLANQALKVQETERKRELLEQGIQLLDHSTELYKQIPGYAKSERNLAEAEDWKRIAQRRLDRLESL